MKNEMRLKRSRWGTRGPDVRKSAGVRRNGRKLPDAVRGQECEKIQNKTRSEETPVDYYFSLSLFQALPKRPKILPKNCVVFLQYTAGSLRQR